MSKWDITQADCVEYMASLPAGSVKAIIADPPYFRVKNEDWDRQWDDRKGFLEWLDTVLAAMHRVLADNGTAWVFASPQLGSHVEVACDRHFNVVNSLVWRKEDGRHRGSGTDHLRSFFPQTERLFMLEKRDSEGFPLAERAYTLTYDRYRGQVFSPIIRYLNEERQAAGLTTDQVSEICGNTTPGRHWFSASQFTFPTLAAYTLLGQKTGRFQKAWVELREEYEEIRGVAEVERERLERELRRPFFPDKQVMTDVWDFPVVPYYEGKHPCEKPDSMLRFMIERCTYPGELVLDPFSGSGSTGVACLKTGRQFIGCDKSGHWVEYGRINCRKQAEQPGLFAEVKQLPKPTQPGLW